MRFQGAPSCSHGKGVSTWPLDVGAHRSCYQGACCSPTQVGRVNYPRPERDRRRVESGRSPMGAPAAFSTKHLPVVGDLCATRFPPPSCPQRRDQYGAGGNQKLGWAARARVRFSSADSSAKEHRQALAASSTTAQSGLRPSFEQTPLEMLGHGRLNSVPPPRDDG